MSSDLAHELLLKTLLPLALLIAAGAIWPRWQTGLPAVALRGEISKLVLNFFAPMLFFAVAATATVDMAKMQKCEVPAVWRERFQAFLLREEDFPRGR